MALSLKPVYKYIRSRRDDWAAARLASIARRAGPSRAIEVFLTLGKVKPSLKNIIRFNEFLTKEYGLSWAVEFAARLFVAIPSRQTYEFLASGRLPRPMVRDIILENAAASGHRGVRQDHYALNLFSETCVALRLGWLAHDAALRAAGSLESMSPNDRARMTSLARALSVAPLGEAWKPIDPMAPPLPAAPPPVARRLLVIEPGLSGEKLQELIKGAQSVSILHFDDLYGKMTLPRLVLAPGQQLHVLHSRSALTRFSKEYRAVHDQSLRLAEDLVGALLRTPVIDCFTNSRTRVRAPLTLEIADRLFFYILTKKALYHELASADYDQKVIAFGAEQRLYRAAMAVPSLAADPDILCHCVSEKLDDRLRFGGRLRVNHEIFSGARPLPVLTRLERYLGRSRAQRQAVATRWIALSRQMKALAARRGASLAAARPPRGGRPRVVFVTNETRAYFSTAMDIVGHLAWDFDVLVAYVGGSTVAMRKALTQLAARQSAPAPADGSQTSEPRTDDAQLAPIEGAGETDLDVTDAAPDAADAVARAPGDESLVGDQEPDEAETPESADTLLGAVKAVPSGDADGESVGAEEEDTHELARMEAAIRMEDADGVISEDELAADGREDDHPGFAAPVGRDAPVALADFLTPESIDLRPHRFAHPKADAHWGALAIEHLAPRLAKIIHSYAGDELAMAALNDLLVEVFTVITPRFLTAYAASERFLQEQRASAVAICPGRSPECFAYGAIARGAKVASLTYEPHALNATYPRYTRISTDYATVVSDYFRQEYDRNFGIPASHCKAIGSPRLERPAGYDSQAARAAARAQLRLGLKGEAVITFMSQPLNWQHMADVWTMIVEAAKRCADPLILAVKTHPEEGPLRARDYLAIAQSLGAGHLTRHVETGPNEMIEASDIVLTCYSVLAMEARIRERDVIIVTAQGREYPVPYHDIVGAPQCESVDDLVAAIDRMLAARGRADAALEHFKRDNPQFFDGGLRQRINDAVREAIDRGPVPHVVEAENASPFVRSEARAFVV